MREEHVPVMSLRLLKRGHPRDHAQGTRLLRAAPTAGSPHTRGTLFSAVLQTPCAGDHPLVRAEHAAASYIVTW